MTAGPESGSGAGTVRIRLFAGAADAVGRGEMELDDPGTIGAVVDSLCAGRAPRCREVLEQCSLLIDGERARGPETAVPPGATVDVLPPFAGGR